MCIMLCLWVVHSVGMDTYICTYVWTYVCMHLCLYVCMYVCMYVCTVSMYLLRHWPKFAYRSKKYFSNYFRMYVCMYVCMYEMVSKWLQTPTWGLHGRVDDGLRMHHDVNIVVLGAEEIMRLDNFQAFVHHRRTVHCNLGTYIYTYTYTYTYTNIKMPIAHTSLNIALHHYKIIMYVLENGNIMMTRQTRKRMHVCVVCTNF